MIIICHMAHGNELKFNHDEKWQVIEMLSWTKQKLFATVPFFAHSLCTRSHRQWMAFATFEKEKQRLKVITIECYIGIPAMSHFKNLSNVWHFAVVFTKRAPIWERIWFFFIRFFSSLASLSWRWNLWYWQELCVRVVLKPQHVSFSSSNHFKQSRIITIRN